MKKSLCLLLIITLISTFISCGPHQNEKIDELVLMMTQGDEFTIVQFADLHFGKEGEQFHNADEARTIDFMRYLAETEKPDLIVLSGDNIMNTGVAGAKELVEIMDSLKTPYTFVFGNHDAESALTGYCKCDVSNYLETSDSPYLLYKAGYIDDSSENRYGNFSISIKDKKTGDLLGAVVIVDTGTYDNAKGQYQSITAGQVEWYKGEITRLNEIYKNQKANNNDIIPTLTYGHMQLPEHFIAYKNASEGNGAEFIYEQQLGGWMANAVLGNTGAESSEFFSAMKELGSARSYICGHMHGLCYHVNTDGIILGFCPQIGVSSNRQKTCKTFVYSFDAEFKINMRMVEEP